MADGRGDWDFTKTDVLAEETQIHAVTQGFDERLEGEVRIYHRAPRISTGVCLDFDNGPRVPIGETIRIGRNFFNEVVVFGSAFVSRRHAEIGDRSGELYLVDLGSRNGTYINGKLVAAREQQRLCPGDTILFGSHVEAKVKEMETPPSSPGE